MITDEDLLKNMGSKHVIFRLIDERRENAERTVMDEMSQAVHGGLTGPAGAQFNGLTTLIATAATTVGGINGAVETWWDNKRATSTGLLNLKDDVRDLYGSIVTKVPSNSRDGIVGVTTRAVFNELEDQLETHGRFTLSDTNPNSVSFGLETIKYNGRDIFWDEDAPSGTLKFANTNFLYLAVHPQRNFNTTEMKSPFDQEFSVAFIRFAGNLVSEFQAAQGVLSGIA